MARPAAIRIGISGWAYPPWRGAFYPKDLPHRLELSYASRMFSSIEINATFYGSQTPDVFARWASEAPDDFVFAVKAPRFITHIRRLREPLDHDDFGSNRSKVMSVIDSKGLERNAGGKPGSTFPHPVLVPLANFLASGVLRLGAKLGPILWQFPPNFRFDAERMDAFLAMLPHDTQAAADLARRHDAHPKGPVWLETDAMRPLRHAVEIRHESFRDSAFIDLLRRYDTALVCADTVTWPRLMDLTSNFVYCRLHGSEELYRSGYDDAALDKWAERVRAWSSGQLMLDGAFAGKPSKRAKRREVFLYFDNTDKLRAPRDAQALMQRLRENAPSRVSWSASASP